MEQDRQYRDPQYVAHILDCIGKIEKYLAGVSRDDFFHPRNDMMQDAVVRELTVIGEIAKRFSRQFRDNNLKIPWDDITGMRDKIVHDYESVDFIVVWETVTEDIPFLKKALTDKGV